MSNCARKLLSFTLLIFFFSGFGCENLPQEKCDETSNCITEYNIADGETPLTPMDVATEYACAEFSETYWIYTITKENPKVFWVLPIPGVRYCVEIIQIGGSVAIQNGEGIVSRDGENFTWCMFREENLTETGINIPARLQIVANTPEARFQARLERGL